MMTRSVELGDDHAATTRVLRMGSVVVALLLIALVWGGAAASHRAETWLVTLFLVAGATLVGSGVIGWGRRPGSRIGPLLVVAGLLFLANGLQVTPWPTSFTVGVLVGESFLNVLGLALLTFPTGRPSTRLEGLLGIVIVGLIFPGMLLPTLFTGPLEVCPSCPRNLLLLAEAPTVLNALDLVTSVGGVVAAAGFVAVVALKWRSATPAARQALAPVVAAGVLLGVVTFGDQVVQLFGAEPARSTAWRTVRLVTILAASLGFLAGLLRTRLTRSAIGQLVVELGRGVYPHGGLREALAQRLGDPSLEIAYHTPERGGYVDATGRSLELPLDGSSRAVTMLETEGQPVAALIHDEFLTHEPEIVEAVAAAARLAIVNEGLRAEVRAKLEEVRASRARIVQAGDAERRRVERNLHDGAQQRLVTMSLALGLVRERIDEEADPDLADQVDALSKELRETIQEVRELARGIHPAILTEEGLLAAVESLAERSPVPIILDLSPIDRFPEPVEATAYFVVAEALTNVAKYARASRVSVRLTRSDAALEVEVADDGQGGAGPRGWVRAPGLTRPSGSYVR